ncbi:hypothetical protein SS50377_23749 [Spironucleus salmonicida]|nr:hypothetical protein SS50377_23749 [Spironucleus salmonicida]
MESNSLRISGWDQKTQSITDSLQQKLRDFGTVKGLFQSYELFFIDVHYTSAEAAESAKTYYENNSRFSDENVSVNLTVKVLESKNQEKQKTQLAQLQKIFAELSEQEKSDFMASLRDMALRNPDDCKCLVESYPVIGWLVDTIIKE